MDGGVLLAQKLGHELEGHPHTASARETLHEGNLVVLKVREVSTVLQLDSLLGEGLEATNGQVLVVHLLGVDLLRGLLHTLQHPRLSIVVTVGTNS